MTDFENVTVSVYALIYSDINKIPDFINQFNRKPEFDLHLVPTLITDDWNTIKDCVKKSSNDDDELIIICNEKHAFTKNYNKDIFLQNVVRAQHMGCDILLSGTTGFSYAVPITDSIFWIDKFNKAEFMIIYQKAFKKILESQIKDLTVSSGLSNLVSNIICTVPFMSSYSNDSNPDPNLEMINTHHHESYNIAQEKLNFYSRIYKKYNIAK